MPDPLETSFIHRFLPATTSGTTVLLLHGTGGDENDLIPIARALVPGAAVLSPRGRVSEHGANRFFRRFAEGVFDLEDVLTRAGELAEFVRGAKIHYGLDASRVYALGYSNGGNIAGALMLLHPDVLAGGVLIRSMFTIGPDNLPHRKTENAAGTAADLAGKQVLLLEGQHDPIVPEASARKLAQVLSASGASVEVRWQNSGHELTPEDFQAVKQWFSTLL